MNTTTKIMRSLAVLTILLFQGTTFFGQTSLSQIDLNNGTYGVGFQHYTTSDSTRTYRRVNDYRNTIIARPIPVSLWYPSSQHKEGKEQLKILDHMKILENHWN